MANRQAEIFKALSVDSRIRIIELLKRHGAMGANEMAKALGVTPSAVSQHLKVLRYAGLVRSERKGYWLPYEIDHTVMAQCRRIVNDVCNCGCKGSCRAETAKKNAPKSELEDLMRRKRELQEDLREIHARIGAMEKKK